MEASTLLYHILIFLFLRTVKADIKLEDGCIKYNADTTITCTLPSGKSVNTDFIFWKFNGDHIVSNGVVINSDQKYGTASTGTTFSLIIHNLAISDIGSYTCEHLDDLVLDFNLMKKDIEYITCNATGGTNIVVIVIEYNNKMVLRPAAEVDGLAASCSYMYVSTYVGGTTVGMCTLNNLAARTYTYTVNNHGECNLMCTGQVTVGEAPTTAPSMNAPTTEAPTTAPSMNAPTTEAPTTTASMNAPITVKLEDGCIKYNADTTITCTLPSGKSVIEGLIFWIFNSVQIVSNGGVIDSNPKYATASTRTTFSLIIHNLAISDIGSYTCEQLYDLVLDINLMKKDIEDITCNAAGDTKEIMISIEYNNKAVQNPVAEVDGKTATCVDASTSAEEPTPGTCTFNNLAAGTYSYTVNNHGACNLMCTGQVTVTEAPTTAPSTNAPRTVNGHEQMAGDITLLISLLLMFNVL